MNLTVRTLALIILALALMAAGWPSGAAASSPENRPDEFVSMLRDWLLNEERDGIPNGLRRKVTYVRQSREGPEEIAAFEEPQSTAACASLEFLSVFYGQAAGNEGRQLRTEEQRILNEFGDAVLSFRAEPNPSDAQIYDGAIAGSDGEGSAIRYFSSFGNAACGHALLAAFKVTGDLRYRAAAIDIADFLLRMQDPSAHYARFGAHPFVGADGNPVPAPGGYVDTVSSWGNLFDVISTWNLHAITFMHEIDDISGVRDGRYAKSAERARDFLVTGLERGFDWFTPRFTSPSTAKNRIVPYRGDPDYDCRDNRWHRKGSCDYVADIAVGGTLGSDMVEYGLAALYDYGRATGDPQAVADAGRLYHRHASLPGWDTATLSWVPAYWIAGNTGSSPTGIPRSFDPHLSFGGYFSPGPGGTELVRAEARYYDIVGFGILAKMRNALVPAKFQHALARLQASGDAAVYAMLDRELRPLWVETIDKTDLDADGSTRDKVWKLTKGTLPTAKIALGVLETVGLSKPRAATVETGTSAGPTDVAPTPAPVPPTVEHSPPSPPRLSETALTLSVGRRQSYRVVARRGLLVRLKTPSGQPVTVTARVSAAGGRSRPRAGTLARRTVTSSALGRGARVRLHRSGRRLLRRLLVQGGSARLTIEAQTGTKKVRKQILVRAGRTRRS